MAGFVLSTGGLAMVSGAGTAEASVMCFALAAFGVEMTISPSWAFCIDLGGSKSGAVSGSMNMAGNIGAFASASIFPLLQHLTGGAAAYFGAAAALNLAAATTWMAMGTRQKAGSS